MHRGLARESLKLIVNVRVKPGGVTGAFTIASRRNSWNSSPGIARHSLCVRPPTVPDDAASRAGLLPARRPDGYSYLALHDIRTFFARHALSQQTQSVRQRARILRSH